MRRPAIGWALPVIAGVAAVIGILGGAYLTVAIPAAALAVVAATLVFAGGWGERAVDVYAPPDQSSVASDRVRRSIRSALRSGRIGREEIVATLDRIDRRFRDPRLSPPSSDEIARISALSHDEFLDYVRGRLDRLEALV